MHHHHALSLAAALFVVPFAAGCVAGEEELTDEVVEVEMSTLAEEDVVSVPYMTCDFSNTHGMSCFYGGGGDLVRWAYDYNYTGWWDGPEYSSANLVNWGHCRAPNGNPYQFTITVRAMRLDGGFPTEALVYCRWP